MKAGSIGFIGGGRITRIFLEGWSRAQSLPSNIIICDPNEAALDKLKLRFPGIETTADVSRAAAQDVVFLATPPPAVADATQKIVSSLRQDAVLISLAPKFTIEKLTSLLGGFSRIVRLAPNAPSVVGLGFNPVVFSSALSAADKTGVIALLSPLGKLPEIEESKMEIYSVLTAMGPTYFWFQLQALREVAVGLGLGDEEAKLALRHMMDGAACTLFDSDLSPVEVMDLIPAKPLAEMEAQVGDLFRTRVPGMYQKIKP